MSFEEKDPYLNRTMPMKLGANLSSSRAGEEDQWLEPEYVQRIEARQAELKKFIDAECAKGNKYMIDMKRKFEREMALKEKRHRVYMRKLQNMSAAKPKPKREVRESWALRWEKKQQQTLHEKFIQMCNVGMTTKTKLMTSFKFYNFCRRAGLVKDVKPSKIIARVRAKARESRRAAGVKPEPAEVIQKNRAYKGAGAVTPATIDILFTKVHAKNQYRRRVVDFEGFLEMIERIAIQVFQCSPEQARDQVCQVISKMKIVLTGSRAQPNKFHDDKGLYTGVWRNGGPRQLSKIITLSNMMDRSPCDIRGVNLYYSQHKLGPFPIRKVLG